MMTTHQPSSVDLAAIKARQQVTWSVGDYSMVGEKLTIVSEELCEAVDLHAGQRVLDVATGIGTTAIAAARRFCEVIGIDFVPALLVRGRERAAAERLQAVFEEGDAENMPFPDAAFDVVLSTFGVMFAPHQEKAASELLRVCRPGGTIGLANWTPSGLFGEMSRIIARYAPPAPGLKSTALWGTEEWIHELFGEGITALRMRKRNFFYRYRSAHHWIEVFGTYFGPIAEPLQALDAMTRAHFSRDLMSLLERYNQAKDGTLIAPIEYLEVVASRR